MRVALVAAALVALLVLAPAVTGSHNMGHRYLVHGRVIDSNGMPVQNQDVEIRLSRSGTYLSSIITRTNCVGDFESWMGRPGTPGAAAHGDGEIESIPASQGRPAYVNFHFHDEFLSSQNQFDLKVLNETWKEGFHSDQRQTNSFHQLGVSAPMACGKYDEFNTTFAVRVYISSPPEQSSMGEPGVKPRTVAVTLDGQDGNGTSGSTNFMATFTAVFRNVSFSEGSDLRIEGTDIGTKNADVDAQAAKFRRYDSINVVGVNAGGILDDLKIFGIVILVVGILGGLYFANKKFQARREEARLRQTSNRRRFRKGREGSQGGPPEGGALR